MKVHVAVIDFAPQSYTLLKYENFYISINNDSESFVMLGVIKIYW